VQGKGLSEVVRTQEKSGRTQEKPPDTGNMAVKSGSTPVGGPVKSGRKQTKEKGRGLDKGLVWPELRLIGCNDKGVEH